MYPLSIGKAHAQTLIGAYEPVGMFVESKTVDIVRLDERAIILVELPRNLAILNDIQSRKLCSHKGGVSRQGLDETGGRR